MVGIISARPASPEQRLGRVWTGVRSRGARRPRLSCYKNTWKDMVQKNGVGALFRGLTGRCVWAASIIAGQFLLYDVFRTYFRVNADDLSQVYTIIIPTN
jgi:Mitochondrial carrier protein